MPRTRATSDGRNERSDILGSAPEGTGHVRESARPQRVPSAAEIRALLATAYVDDPLMRWLFADVEEPVHASAAWLNVFVERYLASGRVDYVATEGALTGVALWRLSDAMPAAASGLPNAGGLFAALVGRSRAETLGRALHVIADITPTEPHAYLHFLAVDPTRQRHGIGSQVLQDGLAAAADRGLGVHLETTNPAAVPFYETHGFTVRAEATLAAGGPQMWAMWRAAPTA